MLMTHHIRTALLVEDAKRLVCWVNSNDSHHYRTVVIQADGVPDAMLCVNQAFMLGGDLSASIYLPDMCFASNIRQV